MEMEDGRLQIEDAQAPVVFRVIRVFRGGRPWSVVAVAEHSNRNVEPNGSS